METYLGAPGNQISQVAFVTFTFPTYMDVAESFMRASLMIEQVVNNITGGKLPQDLEIPYLDYCFERHRTDVHNAKEVNARYDSITAKPDM